MLKLAYPQRKREMKSVDLKLSTVVCRRSRLH